MQTNPRIFNSGGLRASEEVLKDGVADLDASFCERPHSSELLNFATLPARAAGFCKRSLGSSPPAPFLVATMVLVGYALAPCDMGLLLRAGG